MKGKKIQLQGQIEIEAVVLEEMQECLYDSLEWLEVYIEKAGYYPDWQQRKRLPKTIERENVRFMGANEVKGFFSTVLFSLSNFAKTSGVPFVLERLQVQFYSWLDRSGINADNCPKELAECLVNVNNVLNGREEEFRKTRREEVRKNISQMTSEEQEGKFYGAITELQKNLKNEETEKAWLEATKNKNPQDVRMENKFAGNAERGKVIFEQIESKYVPQKNQQIRNPNYKNFVDDPSEEFLNISQWEVKKVVGYGYNGQKFFDEVIVRKNTQPSFDNETGYPLFNPETMLQRTQFSEEAWTEIKKQIQETSQVSHQNQIQQDNRPYGGGSGSGGWGGSANKYVASSLGIISLIGLVLAR